MNKRIPRFDHREQYRAIRREILEAIDRVLDSETVILGPTVRAFEERFAEFLGGDGYGVGVASGTDALIIALRALGIEAGDEVITVSHTSVATISAIRLLGAVPIFCDIDPQTLVMDVRDAEKRITRSTRAIVPVHLYGNAADMPALERLARQAGLKIVEDCAQSCGTRIDGRETGTWGDAGCFSFYPTKNLAAYGDGGLCFARNEEIADRMRAIRNYGMDASQSAVREGMNSRLDEIQAAILEVQLRHLPVYLKKRVAIAECYRGLLSPRIAVPQTTLGAEHSYHLFVVEVDKREEVISRLHDSGIDCGIHYRTPVHLMDAYRFLGYREGSLPHTERAARRVLSLPCYPELSLETAQHICAVLNDACKH